MTSGGLPGGDDAGRSAAAFADKWKVLICVLFGTFIIILDSTVINVALQTLRREFDASLADAQWIISVYVLALGVTTPLSGFLADRFGIKRVYLIGIGLFVLGSFLCGIAPSLWVLVAMRVLQGIGGGLAQPLGSAQLVSAFPPQEQGKAFGFFGIGLVVAPALGPILGGVLIDQNLWRWIFFINVPIGILGVGLGVRWLREQALHRIPALNPLSVVAVVIGAGSVLYAATEAEQHGWGSARVTGFFALGAAGLAFFAYLSLIRDREPLLDLRLYRSRVFLISSLIGYVTVIALFGAEFLMPIYLQALRGRSALETGLMVLPLAVVSGIVIPIAGRLYDKIGPRILVIAGFLVLAVNTWQLAEIERDTTIRWILFLFAMRGLALGLTVQTTFVAALSVIQGPAVARGTSLINSTRFIVQAIGVAVLATVLASTLSPEVKEFTRQAQEQAAASDVRPAGICETPGSEFGPPAAIPPTAKAGLDLACQQNVDGFEKAYKLTFYLALVAAVIALFLPGWPGGWAGRGFESGPRGSPAIGH